ncbi:hypothetical protein GW915_00160 [bacterium]|nr:hypothetical protein [bacterium]
MQKLIATLLFSTLSFTSLAFNTVVKSKLDIAKSSNGQPVQLRIVVTTDSPSYVGFPRTPLLADWEILKKQEIADIRTYEKNGKLVRTNIKYFIYVLKPLKSGKVPIPGFTVSVGKAQFKTETKIASVEPFTNGGNGPVVTNPLPNLPDNPSDEFFESEDLGLGNSAQLDTSKKIMFVAEVDKEEVFVGEMIKVSFNLYRRNIQDINHDYKKFPVFEGFLKEDLFLPRALPRNTVSIQGVPYQSTEFARFALFPLKEGLLTVDSFDLRYEIVPLSVNGFSIGGQPIPQTISSKPVKIFSKPLPAVPSDIEFSGSVGDFNWEVTPPPTNVTANQPFTLTITISGEGNIKSIEAPTVAMPTGVESHGVKPFPKVDENAQGSIKFDYLFVPRTAGQLDVPKLSWTFFNPKKKEYISLENDPMTIQVEGNNTAVANNPSNDKKQPQHELPPIQIKQQSFSSVSSSTSFVKLREWAVLWASYLSLGIFFFIRKQKNQSDEHARAKPWKTTESYILKKSSRPEGRLASLIDQYSREFITGVLSNENITPKSTNDEIIDALYRVTPPEYHKNILILKKFFNDLDHTRFAGKKSVKVSCDNQLKRAKMILEKVEQHITKPTTFS